MKKLKNLVLAALLAGSILSLRAQSCYQQGTCTNYANFGYNSETFEDGNAAATLEYDNYVSGYFSTIVRDYDGTFKIWGEASGWQGTPAYSHHVPTEINATNYPGLTGVPLKVAVGSYGGTDPLGSNLGVQFVLLTSDNKLWAWGKRGIVLSTSLTTSTEFQEAAIGLPSGVTATDVKMFFGTQKTLVITTCSGEVWVLNCEAGLSPGGMRGAGSSATNTRQWYQVQKSTGGALDNVIVARGSAQTLLALDSNGDLWTWGNYVYLGNGSAKAEHGAVNKATKMALPLHSGAIKMIGTTNFGSYYVLYEDGYLYSLGRNQHGEAGVWNTTEQLNWVQPRYQSANAASTMKDVVWISPIEHDGVRSAINIINEDKQIWNFGIEFGAILGRGNTSMTAASSTHPGQPTDFQTGYTNNNFIAVETGGSTTMMQHECSNKLGYVGYRYNGNRGDNSSTSGPDNTVRFTTNALQACGDIEGAPVFATGLPTQRCSGSGTVAYPATTSGSGITITYTLSPAAAGTIDAATGVVTYNASWSGTAVITATATGGCGIPEAQHTVTVTASVGVPVFGGDLSAQRCSGAGTVTYTATATNADDITYSLSPAAAGTIDPSTGVVTYNASWSGSATITATATGCDATETAAFEVHSDAIFANDDAYSGPQSAPIVFNVLSNDLCNVDPASVEQIGAPAVGILQHLGNGEFQYIPVGNFSGDVTFQYKICSNTAPVVCDIATVTITIINSLEDPCFGAGNPQVYYMPFPENTTQLGKALKSAADANGNSYHTANARNVTSISVTYPGTVLIYDHWEDGYESNILFPAQSTTQIWGDGDLTNGVAPGYPYDLIPAGAYIELDNTFAWNRTSSTVVYDGKDKIWTSSVVSITKVSGDGSASVFGLQSTKTNVPDASKTGQTFVLPFGEDVNVTNVFRYTGVFVHAIEDGTQVTLNYNPANPAATVTSPVLNEGQVWFYDGTAGTPGVASNVNNANDIKKGAVITSDKPVGVNMVFGGIDAFGTRNIPVYPAEFYGSAYMSPVYSTNTANPVYGYFVNPNAGTITINWTRSAGSPTSGSFTIPGNYGLATFNMNVASGTRFESDGGEPYTAVTIVDDPATSSTGTGGSTYDWAFPMIALHRLTNFGTLGWAPGNSNGSTTENYQPIWVTPIEDARVYVKYDGDITTGDPAKQITDEGSAQSAYYDVYYDLTALQAQLIYGPNGDNSGIAVFTNDVDPNKLAIAWGERPFDGTPTGTPALDVGYVVEPKCLQKMILAVDDRVYTARNTPITIDVASNDQGYLITIDPTSVNTDYLQGPANGSITLNPDGTITYTPNIGFIGYDQFEYSICGAAPNTNTCDVATVYVSVPCDLIPGQNIVKGTVYSDFDGNGTADPAETALAGITMQLFEDMNGDGLYDAGDVLLDETTTNAEGSYSFALDQGFRIIDSFNTNGVGTGNDGTVNWTGNWLEIGETNGFSTGNVLVTGNRLRIIGSGNATQFGASRSANLDGAITAMLSYDWVKSQFSSATNTIDFVEVQIRKSTSDSWVPLKRYFGIAADAGTESFDISGFISATTAIRIVESNNTDFTYTEYVEFDNVTIRYEIEKDYLIRVAPSSLEDGYTITEPQTEVQSFNFTGVNNGLCDVNFGLKGFDISGMVWHDHSNGNAIQDGTEKPVSGSNDDNSGNATVTGGVIYANLVDNVTGSIVATTQVQPDGSYRFLSVKEGDYSVILTNAVQTVTDPLTSADASLPTDWFATGVNVEGIPDVTNKTNMIVLGIVTEDKEGINFGIQQPPVADPKVFEVVPTAFSNTPAIPGFDPVPGYQSIVMASDDLNNPAYLTDLKGTLSGTDPEDCPVTSDCRSGSTFVINAIYENTKLYYDFGTGPVEIDVTSGPVEIENFDVEKMVIYAENGSGTSNGGEIGFTYSIVDRAGAASEPVTYEITTTSPLPVNLVAFEAVKGDASNHLTWTTTAESDARGFEIQRSTNGKDWNKIGFVNSLAENGNSQGSLIYGFADTLPLSGLNYYRLKMVDLDGKFEYSRIRSVRNDAHSVVIYPNPATHLIKISQGTDIEKVKVLNMQGQTIKEMSLTDNQYEVSVSDLPAGVYLLQMISPSGESDIRKFIKQ